MSTLPQLSGITEQQATFCTNAPQRRLRKRSAIIIDDDVDSLAILCGLLSLYRIPAQTIDNSIAAYELIQLVQPGFVITDLLMPNKNGWSLLSEIKENPTTQHIPVIAITAYTHPTLDADTARAGFKGVLSKPVDQSEFYKVVRQVFTND